MRKGIYVVFLVLSSLKLFSQTEYSGFIDKFPIELVTNIYSDGIVNGIYTYSRIDDPILLKGTLKDNILTLFEKDNKNGNSAVLVFKNFSGNSNEVKGTWTNLKSKRQLIVILNKMFDLENDVDTVWSDREILQPVSINDKYFKLLVSKRKERDFPSVTGIKILQKKTDKLIQKIDLDCELRGLSNIQTDDYNFDGTIDFSVFEGSYAGANTSSIYYLFDPKTNKYFNSGFTGTSLEFNSKSKRIFERNQCCAGSTVTTAEYKLVNNKMILLKEHCFKWNNKKQKLIERNLKECQ